jgi:8-oxo-dGTP diphosphatase
VLDRLKRASRVRRELRVAAYAVCIDDGKMLLARFIEDGNPRWTLPGGGLDHGEDPYDAVIREVEEETGYEIEVTSLLGISSGRYTFPRGRFAVVNHHAIRVMYAGRVIGGSLRHEVGGSTDQAAWIELDRLDKLTRAEIIDIGLDLARERPSHGQQRSAA